MKSTFSLILLLVAFQPVLYAQFSAGPEFAIPVGDFRHNYYLPYGGYNYGLGASVKYLYKINRTFGVSLQTGAIRYHGSTIKGYDFFAIPVKLGANIRYRSLFAAPQVGLTYFAYNKTYYENGSTTYGVNIGTSLSSHLLLSGNYERWNKGGYKASHVGVSLAYAFSSSQHRYDSLERKVRINYDKSSENWQKHKTCQALGWTSLGIGVPLTLIGLVSTIANAYNKEDNSAAAKWMLGSGAVLTTSSIPLFILSHKYKKKAV
jgi:hypothetical protein